MPLLLAGALALAGGGGGGGGAGARGGGAPGPELAVMSFNIRYGTANDGPDAWPNRRDQVVGLIGREAPDVIGTQEALRFQLDEIRRALPVYGEAGVGRDDGGEAGEYAAILFRADRLELLASGTFWLSDRPDVPGSATWGNRVTRICTWARLRDRAGGRSFAVYNVHLDHESQPARERGVALVLERIARRADGRGAREPALLLGDFNAGETNPATGAARAAGFRDAFRARHPRDSVVGTFNAFRGDSTGEKIDYVFVPAGVEVLDARILRDRAGGRFPSDHFPVAARLRLPR